MRTIPASELIINNDGSIFHLHVRPDQIATTILLCGDPKRVDLIASHFDTIECDISSREFHTITGTYRGKRLSCVSHGIGCDNIDIVVEPRGLELAAIPHTHIIGYAPLTTILEAVY